MAGLVGLWPAYLGYLISFPTIGIMWANHHTIFRLIARTDHYLVLLNLLLLLCIGFIPFTTALLTEYAKEPERAAVGGIVYSGWFLVTALAWFPLWRYASHGRRLIDPAASERAVRSIGNRFRLGPPGYAIAFALSFVSTAASLAVLVGFALAYVLPYAGAGELAAT